MSDESLRLVLPVNVVLPPRSTLAVARLGVFAETARLNNATEFLAQRGVHLRDDEIAQIEMPWRLFGAGLNEMERFRYASARRRLSNLLGNDDSIEVADAPPAVDCVPQLSPEEFPEYFGSPDAYLSLVGDPSVLVQCFDADVTLHSLIPAALVQYYAIWHAARRENTAAMCNHGVLNVLHEIRTRWFGQQLYKYVFEMHDDACSSVDFLKSILQEDSKLITPPSQSFAACLRRYGPALVSGFMMHTDFSDERVHRHSGEPVGAVVGFHAMVLVGVRRDVGDKVALLLQHAGLHKQFVEVSQEYFEACNPTVYFVKTAQKVPLITGKQRLQGRWLATRLVDVPDKAAPERV